MQEIELKELINQVITKKAETNKVELKTALGGNPQRIYDTLSAFSNTEGGVIIFGVDESNDFKITGVYDIQDLQHKVAEQCKQMEPEVRPVLTPTVIEGKFLLGAEIPEIDYTQKPCFYKGQGRLKGSYTRVGESDEPMTEYEIYTYEAFRQKKYDDIRPIEQAVGKKIDEEKLDQFLNLLKTNRPNLTIFNKQDILDLNSLTKNSVPTIAYVLLFSIYPQAIFPNLCINATVVPGYEIGDVDNLGIRFIDNKKIEGTLPEMIETAIAFVSKNMRTNVIIDNKTAKRADITEYPITAIREAVLNAVIHRDYSVHTENQPIQLVMYKDRLEITNPGGLYGRLTLNNLGKVQPDTRNPNIAKILELFKVTENRYSGIPTIINEMRKRNLPDPKFINNANMFKIILFNSPISMQIKAENIPAQILIYCNTPKSLEELARYFNMKTKSHLKTMYIDPLLKGNKLKLTIPEKPKSKFQKFISVQ